MTLISDGAGFNTNGVTCLDWIESLKIKSLPPEYINNSHDFIRFNQIYLKSLKSPLNQSDSEIITGSNKLQSSSVKQPENQSAEGIPRLKKELDTPDILQSSEVIPIPSVDTAEGTFLPPIPTCTQPSAVTPSYENHLLFLSMRLHKNRRKVYKLGLCSII